MSTQENPTLPELTTVDEVIDVLGGNPSVRDLVKAKSSQVVSAWRSNGRIATHYYIIMTSALNEKGFRARPELWGMVLASDTIANAAAG